MPNTSYPNQRMIHIHREPAKSDFLGIKNENWQAAARNLGAHASLLYLYLASNANNYTLALSPAAVRQAIGMARSTYHDQFHKLVDKGYLVQSKNNTYEFYETPQTVTPPVKNSVSEDGYNFEECTDDGHALLPSGHSVLAQDIEINNIEFPDKTETNNHIKPEVQPEFLCIPKVEEIVIALPKAEGKRRPQYQPQPERKVFDF